MSINDNTSDVYGHALVDYYNDEFEGELLVHNSYGDAENMPIEVFFREEEDLSELELYALQLCNGKVLDVGAGAGVHTLILQERGMDITALDNSHWACEVMKGRGVKNVINEDINELPPAKTYNTLLMLMNGTGVLGSLEGFKQFLKYAKNLIADTGKIVVDSSDISYLYTGGKPEDRYFGEIDYQYEYKDEKGEKFSWLYIDPHTLTMVAKEMGWNTQVVFEGEQDDFLAVLTKK